MLLVVVVLFAALIGYDNFTSERDRRQHDEALSELKRGVAGSAAFDSQACFGTQPFKIEFQNNTKTTIERIGFHLYVTQKGRSTVLNDEYRTYESDFILQPGDRTTGCWQVMNKSRYQPLVADDGPFEVRIELTEIQTSEGSNESAH